MRNGIARLLSPLAAAAVLVACGGSGGGTVQPPTGGNPPPTPTIAAVAFSGSEDSDLAAQLQASGGTSPSFTRRSDPTRGTLSTFSSSGSFTYRPAPDFSGQDSFSVQVTNAEGGTATATITLNIAPQNDAPIARADIYEFTPAATVILPVLRNDVDADGEQPQVSVIRTLVAAGLAATVDSSGQIVLALPAGFTGLAGVEYQIRDSAGATSAAKAMAFVGMSKLDLVFSATGASGLRELYFTDFASIRQITSAPQGNVLQHFLSADRSKATFARAISDPATGNVLSVSLHVQAVEAGSTALNVPVPVGRSIATNGFTTILPNIALSRDGRWLAFVVVVDGSQNQGTLQNELYFLDTSVAGATPFRVTASIPSALWNLEFQPTGELTFVGSSVGPPELNGLFVASEVYSTRPETPGLSIRLSVGQDPLFPNGNTNLFVFRNTQLDRLVITGQRQSRTSITVVNPAVPGVESPALQLPPGAIALPGAPIVATGRDLFAAMYSFPGNPQAHFLLRSSVSGSFPAVTVPIAPGFTPNPRSPSLVAISPDGSHVLSRATEPDVPFVTFRVFIREINLDNPGQDRDLGSFIVGTNTSVFGHYSAQGSHVLLHSAQARPVLVDLNSPGSRVDVSPVLPVVSTRAIDGRIYLLLGDSGLHVGNFLSPLASFDVLSLGEGLTSPFIVNRQFGSRSN